MASANAVNLDALLRAVEFSDAALQALVSQLAEDSGVIPPDFQPGSIDDQGKLDEKAKTTCPECGHKF